MKRAKRRQFLEFHIKQQLSAFQSSIQMRAQDLPAFKDLPPVAGLPHGCAWGIWDKNGEKDQLGSLNLLTPEIVREAGKEIETGERCVLKY
jgi:hypothetical protein